MAALTSGHAPRCCARSPISDAAHTLGATPQDIEAWLVTILEHWRAANPGASLEPWDYWSRYTSDTHPLDARVPPESITPTSRVSANVMLDVAWGLFELRMFQDPDADPNAVWTAITSTYLNIRPHPELAWWALRVQLVDIPGYMISYGTRPGTCFASACRSTRPSCYAASWVVLGRPVSSTALVAQLDRIQPQPMRFPCDCSTRQDPKGSSA